MGWRQGSFQGTEFSKNAAEHAPPTLEVKDADRMVLTCHDCDFLNFSIEKEPVVEVLLMRPVGGDKPDRSLMSGRNPCVLQLTIETRDTTTYFACTVHERWTIPRTLLMEETPSQFLPNRERRLLAEWLAKRYIRAAFPTAFDQRWRPRMTGWLKLLRNHSEWMQGVYLRLNTLDELSADKPYRCHFIVAVPQTKRGGAAASWPRPSAAASAGPSRTAGSRR